MGTDKPGKDRIFIIAAEILDPAKRAAYLDDACGTDASLREEVEGLLRHDQEGASFLESPPHGVDATIDQPITEGPGTVIGPYKLLQQIGEGGFGVVYMADQKEPVKRRVALKIIKPGMDTQQVIARFEAERQALAMMDHPNIAKVLDAGTTESGRPYFVMELVKGVPITQFCDERHLTPRERLELFVPVCQALQHAHQKGIIHRDIKPSNVLVAKYDDRPVPKVIDFGVIKAIEQHLTEKTMFTQFGQVVGTVDYMSPEQADLNQLDIDTRSDIYSLGVLLYELLAGNTPFDRRRLRSAAFDELLRIIREEEPPKPSLRLSTSESLPSIADSRHTEPKKLSALVHGELDWIVMKALEKDRTRRYETATGFANDIKRYLNDEAVSACPPSRAYRFRKFARRNRVALTTGAIVFTALAMGVIGTAWQARQATLSRDRARQAEERALQAEGRAVQNLESALTSVDKMLTRIADEKLTNVPFMEEVRRALLEDALTIYRQLLASTEDRPKTGLETARAQRRLTRILLDLGRTGQAEESIQAAVELLTTMLEQSPNNSQLEFELAQIRILQSRIATDSLKSRIAHLDQAAEILDRLSKENGASREKKAELAFCLSVMATYLKATGDRSQSQEAFQKAEGVFEELLDQDPRDQDVMVPYAMHLQNWGGSFMDIGDWQTAEAKYRNAAKVGQSLLALDQQQAQARLIYSVALGNVAGACFRQNQHQESDSLLRETLEIQRALVRDYPSFPDYRLRLSGSLMSLGGSCSETGETERGIQYLDEAVELLEYLTDNWPAVRKYHAVLGGTLNNLAELVRQQGRDLEKAEELAKRAIEHQRRAIEDPENPNIYLLQHYKVLAQVQMQRGHAQEALVTCEEGLQAGQLLGKKFPDNDVVSTTLGELRKMKEAAIAASSVADDASQQNDRDGPKSNEPVEASAGPADPTETKR